MMRIAASLGLLFVLMSIAGCATNRISKPPIIKARPELADVDALLKEEKYTEAIEWCIALSRLDPLMPGLAERQARIVQALSAQRAKAAELRQASTQERMVVDVEKNKALPDNYESRFPSVGETNSLRTAESPMEAMTHKKVTVNLDNATLQDFVLAMGSSQGINMVTDNLAGGDRTFSIHAENVPLLEILDYVSRNMGVAFHVGDDLIWATPVGAGEATVPMETRLYRLRKGLPTSEAVDASGAMGAARASGAPSAPSAPGDTVTLVDTIKRFVPQAEGADLFLDKNAHVLIVKNTRENLAKVEDLIEALDVTPPQILIEARFISIGADDLLELGIDWTLDSNWKISDKTVVKNGRSIEAAETRIDKGATIKGTGFADTAAQGLNLTYRGVLTDPMFSAVLHALESSGKSRTLSVPKVATVNNRMASIRLGEDFRYFDEYDIQSTPSALNNGGATTYTTTLVPVGKPVLEELGIELKVTPSVGADRRDISLHVVPDISDFVRYEYYQTGAGNGGDLSQTNQGLSVVKLPIFRRSHIETEVIVQSGETVVMGGLISSTEQKIQEGVPILSKIPLLGVLFRHDKMQEKKDNLLIFVTATLLSNRGENMISTVSPVPAAPPDAGAGATLGATNAPAPTAVTPL